MARREQFVVDVVLAQTGSVGLVGPFRSERQAVACRERLCRAIDRAGLTDVYIVSLSEVVPPTGWRDVVDLTPLDGES